MSAVQVVGQDVALSAAPLIDDRYRIEKVLGRGGMGEVLAVVDESTSKRFALKRLLAGAKPRHAMLLSREFHTLHGLSHPHVIRAFDYGVSHGTPYYTMELLDGSDVEQLAPVPWQQVVTILRDVASALALIHARHLVHRDVSARNVWRTQEGTVKLIDFGTLASFGEASDIAGTPPYLAPEALRSRILDQRTDLYSLGALAYFLITGRHACNARAFSELEQHWAEGFSSLAARWAQLERADLPPPPEALAHLVDSLLALDRDARPTSSAEVLERLEQVLPSAEGTAPQAAQGMLLSKAFVGREHVLRRVASLIGRSDERVSASAALLGGQGSGRSRLLEQVALEARLAGISVVALAGDGDRRALSAATRATQKLVEVLPSISRACAAPHAHVLGHLSDDLRSAFAIAVDALEAFPETAGEARLRLTSALHELWSDVARREALVLALDDFEEMDEASRGFFSALARKGEAPLLVVAAVRTEHDATVPYSAKAFVNNAITIPLDPLSGDECRTMLRSMFGDAAHLERMASRLAEQSEGNPGRLMELCTFLIHEGYVRWQEGAWTLPQEIGTLSLPSSRESLRAANVARLSHEALKLSQALSVIEGPLSLEMALALSPLQAGHTFRALEELCAARVLSGTEQGYRVRDESMRLSLYQQLEAESAQRVHGLAADELLRAGQPDLLTRVVAGYHLLRGGRAAEGAELIARASWDTGSNPPEEAQELGRYVEQALPHLRALKLSDADLLGPLTLLSWCGFFADRRFGFSYGAEALAIAQEVCGMNTARRLRPWFGRKLALYIALVFSAIKLKRAAKTSALTPSFENAVQCLVSVSACLSGMYTLCIDYPKVLESAAAIEPLCALGPDHVASIVHDFGVCCAGTVANRQGETRRRWEHLLGRLDDPRPIKGLRGNMLIYYQAAALYGFGGSEAWRDKSRSLEIADRLERQPLKLYQLSADQVRALYYAHQGNMREALRFRSRVETRALQRGMTWQVEVWEPSSALVSASRQHDALTIKRAAGQLDHLAKDVPSLRPYVQLARATQLLMRGHYAEALPILDQVYRTRDPNSIGRANLVAQLAQAYNGLERYAESKALCDAELATMGEQDLGYPPLTHRLLIERALAESGLGNHELAAARLDALIAEHTPNEGPLTLGNLHEARASVALRAQQEEAAREHFTAMERWYRTTDCPGLIQRCDRIAKRWRTSRTQDAPLLPSLSFLANVSTRLSSGTIIQESTQELLLQLLRSAMASEGVLLLTGRDAGPQLWKSREHELPEGLPAWIEGRVAAASHVTTETQCSEGGEIVDLNVISFEDKSWRLNLLVAEEAGEEIVVGAVALCTPLTQVPLDLLGILARHFRVNSRTVSHDSLPRPSEVSDG